jgi:hypothetical protein
LNIDGYRGHRTLIVGEVHSGKTLATLKIFRDWRRSSRESIAVLDLAPEEMDRVGGKMPFKEEEKEGILYLSPRILPPRLLGKSETGIRRLARENRKRIDRALSTLRSCAASVLFINDLSLYLHDGEGEKIWLSLENISTVVMNGYYGRFFGSSPLSQRERAEMEFLMVRCDRVLFLPPFHGTRHQRIDN